LDYAEGVDPDVFQTQPFGYLDGVLECLGKGGC
jgi:hypothetical protein